jgi:hypothetical protein
MNGAPSITIKQDVSFFMNLRSRVTLRRLPVTRRMGLQALRKLDWSCGTNTKEVIIAKVNGDKLARMEIIH